MSGRGVWVPPSGGRAMVVSQTIRGHQVRATGRHLAYLQRDGVGEDGGRGPLYTAEGRDLDPETFRQDAREDVSQYRLVVSPWMRGEHMQAFTRELMQRAERDLRTETQWVAADHHNTNHVHRARAMKLWRFYITPWRRRLQEIEAQAARETQLMRERDEAKEMLALTCRGLEAKLRDLAMKNALLTGECRAHTRAIQAAKLARSVPCAKTGLCLSHARRRLVQNRYEPIS